MANTDLGGVYIFGGNKNTTAPYDGTGVYQGDNGTREVEVAPGLKVSMNVPGREIFGTGSDDDGSGAARDG